MHLENEEESLPLHYVANDLHPLREIGTKGSHNHYPSARVRVDDNDTRDTCRSAVFLHFRCIETLKSENLRQHICKTSIAYIACSVLPRSKHGAVIYSEICC